MSKINKRVLWVIVLIPVCCGILAINSRSQDLINSSVFVFARPGSAQAAGGKATDKWAANRIYRKHRQLAPRSHKGLSAKGPKSTEASKPKRSESANLKNAEKLGITLWRLRPERTGEPGARLLTMNGSSKDPAKLVAERVAFDTVFKMGDKVRFSVESSQLGYLYIIDREQRKDNAHGTPYLVFPTLKTRGGDNLVGGGKVVEIPSQTDIQSYFDITSKEENYAGELITLIVSPTRLEGLQIGADALELAAGQVGAWENMWERKATIFELEDSNIEARNGLLYTEEEKEAGTGRSVLTRSAPPPQTMIVAKSSKEKAFMVSFALAVSK